ncbi:MAG: Holliday junction branch migration protein RuvA [Planctomycetota bacterium]
MYEFLEGEIVARSPARVVLLVAGVAYDLAVPLSSHLPASGRQRIYTHLVVREDAHLLYGFQDRETRDLFRLLLSVRGVGPTMALSLLSGLPREPLLAAVAHGDAASLTRVRGVGKKTAEQILLDMRDKAQALLAELRPSANAAARAPVPGGANLEDAVQALISIGYSEKEARKQVERAARSVDPTDLESLVRAALAG